MNRKYEVALDPDLKVIWPFPVSDDATKEATVGEYFFYPDMVNGKPYPREKRNLDIIVSVPQRVSKKDMKRLAVEKATKLAQDLKDSGNWGIDGDYSTERLNKIIGGGA